MSLSETSEAVTCDRSQRNDAASELYNNLLQVARLVLFPPELSSPLDDMPVSQVRCLSVIGGEEGKKMQEIATRLRIKLPAMSQMVDRLVRKGLIERRPDPTDRRVARLHLTDTAREMITESRQSRMQYLQQLTQSLELKEIQQIAHSLHSLLSLEEASSEHKEMYTHNDNNRSVGTIERQDPLVDMLAQRARNSRG